MLTPTLKDSISHRFGSVPDVESVFTSTQGRVFYVWVVVNDPDRHVRRKLYEIEREIHSDFDMLEFDFGIISRRGRPLADVISDPSLDLAFSR